MLKIYNPRQTVLITSRDKIDLYGKSTIKDNIMTCDWHTPISFKPLYYAVSISTQSLTHSLIEKSRVFCINFIPETMKKEAILCGRHSGTHTDKFEATGLGKSECEKIDGPRITEALGYLECELEDIKAYGDHTLFVGKILHSHLQNLDKRLFHTYENDFTTTK
ncbi:flavin reductase family protein [Candidatus Woesearchaeota archaeon]|nr:flavin reductase family protein [Candidatus Woesearchaeota archaeon]